MAERTGPAPRVRVIGVGNDARGDDGVGRRVARLLRGRLPQDVEILEHDGEASSLLEYLQSAAAVFLVDAAVSAASPGSIKRFDCVRERLPSSVLAVSTHGFGVAEAVELARALGCLPECCVLYAIEAETVAAGANLSDAACAAAESVAGRVAAALARRGFGSAGGPRAGVSRSS